MSTSTNLKLVLELAGKVTCREELDRALPLIGGYKAKRLRLSMERAGWRPISCKIVQTHLADT